jgi:protein arginine N-methyltransferase 1
MPQLPDEHRKLLKDSIRLQAFQRAIEEIVKPGMVVCDLASGTGILGLMALRAGAQRLYSLEVTSLIGLTREIARANGYGDQMVGVRELSTRAELPEPVDVVIADQHGGFGFEAGVFEYFADAKRRLLRPGGTLIPAAVELWAAPVEAADAWSAVDFWSAPVAGFDLSPARRMAANKGYPVVLEPPQLLAAPMHLGTFETGDRASHWRCLVEGTVDRSATLHGIGAWFAALLSPTSRMTNSPGAPDRLARPNVFFPVDRPVAVCPGDHIRVEFQIAHAETMVAWRLEIWDGHERDPATPPTARFIQSTWEGALISEEDLRTSRPDWSPRLTSRGQARLSVLELCDGANRLTDIEREMQRRHPQLLPDESQAARFVAEAVARYAK